MAKAKRAEFIRTIRLDDKGLEQLLDRLDTDMPPDASNPAEQEYPYRLRSCVIYVQQPGDGTSVAYITPTRLLSMRTLTFIHGGFIHPQSGCIVQLISQQGTWENVHGEVTTCTHIEGAIHQIGVRFETVVDVAAYCPDSVKVRVLFVEDDPALAKLGQAYLERLNAEVDYAENGKKMVEMASEQLYDLILTDIEMPEMDGLESTKTLRDQGYAGKIVAATGRTRPEDRQACLEAGCNAYIAKPYQLDDLRELFESLREEPLLSTLQEDSEMVELINGFVIELPGKVRAIEEAEQNKDHEKLEVLARQLKGEAGGFGYEPISDAASRVERAVQDDQGEAAMASALSELVHWSQLARGKEV